MENLENILKLTEKQFLDIINAVTDKSKTIFISKSTYNTKIAELESTIETLKGRVKALEDVVIVDENKPSESTGD